MKRTIITVDTTQENHLAELLEALAEPKAKIISEASAGSTVIYIIETPNK